MFTELRKIKWSTWGLVLFNGVVTGLLVNKGNFEAAVWCVLFTISMVFIEIQSLTIRTQQEMVDDLIKIADDSVALLREHSLGPSPSRLDRFSKRPDSDIVSL